jgi:anti-anti-sigma factor
MNQTIGAFELEWKGETLVLTPQINWGELAFQAMEPGATEILERLTNTVTKYVVLDCCRTDYFGTSVLSYCLKLWEKVKNQGGQLVFCNVSDHEKEILQFMKLDSLWTICGSREEAMQAVCT